MPHRRLAEPYSLGVPLSYANKFMGRYFPELDISKLSVAEKLATYRQCSSTAHIILENFFRVYPANYQDKIAKARAWIALIETRPKYACALSLQVIEDSLKLSSLADSVETLAALYAFSALIGGKVVQGAVNSPYCLNQYALLGELEILMDIFPKYAPVVRYNWHEMHEHSDRPILGSKRKVRFSAPRASVLEFCKEQPVADMKSVIFFAQMQSETPHASIPPAANSGVLATNVDPKSKTISCHSEPGMELKSDEIKVREAGVATVIAPPVTLAKKIGSRIKNIFYSEGNDCLPFK